MSNLWLTVDVAPGADISNTCKEAIELANKTGLSIWFNFNGVKCLARIGDDPHRLEADWKKILDSKVKYKIASDSGK